MAKVNESNIFFNPNIFINKNKQEKIDKNKNKIKTESKDIKLFDNLLSEKLNEDNLINNEEEIKYKNLEENLKEIGLIGERLKKSLLLEDLDCYKKCVKNYITNIIKISQEMQTKVVWNKFKKEKISKIHLINIDQELLELTKYFFEDQKPIFKIISKIDKIEGILFDFLL